MSVVTEASTTPPADRASMVTVPVSFASMLARANVSTTSP